MRTSEDDSDRQSAIGEDGGEPAIGDSEPCGRDDPVAGDALRQDSRRMTFEHVERFCPGHRSTGPLPIGQLTFPPEFRQPGSARNGGPLFLSTTGRHPSMHSPAADIARRLARMPRPFCRHYRHERAANRAATGSLAMRIITPGRSLYVRLTGPISWSRCRRKNGRFRQPGQARGPSGPDRPEHGLSPR